MRLPRRWAAAVSGVPLAFAAFVCVLATGVLWFRRAVAVKLPENRSGFVVAMAAGVLLAFAAFFQGAGGLGGVPAGLAMLGGSFFLLTVSISRQKGGSGALQVGLPVPDVTAPDENGKPFKLSSLSGQPVLLKVFRGHW